MDYLNGRADKHGITIYTTNISVDLALHGQFRVKVGMGGIMIYCITKSKKKSRP